MRQGGSIIKKRKRYYIVYRTAAGKQKWEGGFDTKGAAQTRLTDVLGQIQTSSYVEPSEMLFGEFADQWLKNRISISGSTWEGYDSYLTAHIKPELGKMKLKDIRPVHVQDLITRLATQDQKKRGKPLSANTVRKMATMLVTLFKSAVKSGLIRSNPAKDLELPKAVKAKIQPPSKKDVLAILQQAPVHLSASPDASEDQFIFSWNGSLEDWTNKERPAATTFDIYGHLMPKAKQEATKRFERSLFGKKASVRTLLERLPQKVLPDTVN